MYACYAVWHTADAGPETVPAQPGAPGPVPAAEAGTAAASATPATTTPTAPSNGTPAEDAQKTGAQAAAPGPRCDLLLQWLDLAHPPLRADGG